MSEELLVVLAGRVLLESSEQGQGSGMLVDILRCTGQPPTTKNNLAINPAREENTAKMKLVKEMMRHEKKKGIFFPFGCVTQVHQVELLKGSGSGIQTDQVNH